ncbi:3-oxoacyl-[acyl-carrier-protein] synthase III C-terminal domain-containing protein [Metabacillus fastidiosus]|uniref:3-oxoacyl-[acyl-carrier-protein] synthase III C-terminal domain-containing protein n=1 Tax=Metabacillus fastidiosus TaxID=1458 RepID=A0ABU6NVJ8_9BACI|nr:3-oxoacyl-[acyl-carrier-protein] synthase III C-terminal domain-containing protein [Metabacillus fastidiosus]MED4400648.1 3-oxoacyl-[acyl-carrier-protein] synthase III C-terminal domain-containing protein [Metabacillus fastidiosus]MED4453777.1 3-oxoacyl-[acyl-carrier-protein] synthase III C-terminal domain-containing protein [Metabacillus fastidiosus]MED4462819.1 3-oxoacyl-[acyl-carrier-protein] synthase III C-terminal domain-containing protein [Metabacillus fastidiosus]
MAFIISVGKGIPEYELTQDYMITFVRELFGHRFTDIDRLLTVFPNSEIKTRQFVKEIDWYKHTHSFAEKNDEYIKKTVELSVKAIENCLRNEELLTRSISYDEIDAIIFISSSGIATPSIDAKVMNCLPFKETAKRIPIWGLGCAGGAAGISRAYEYCRAFPEAKVLVIAAELCSLTFQHDDLSKANLIGTSLFGDGVACTLIAGEKAAEQLKQDLRFPSIPKIIETRSTLMKDSEDVMGWDIKDNGLYVIFSRHIPAIIKKWLKPNVEAFLEENGLHTSEISHFLAHPGGKKVIEAYKDGLGFTDDHLYVSKEVLEQHGNMSSVTVMYVISEYLERQIGKDGEFGLIGALGPGFSSELLFIEWKGV